MSLFHDVDTRMVLAADHVRTLGSLRIGRVPSLRRPLGKGLVLLGLWVAGEPSRRRRQVLPRAASS